MQGSSVLLLHAGTCTVDADQAGDADYLAAPTARQSFTVTAGGAAITSQATALAMAETPISYTVTTSGSPTPLLKCKGRLPPGIRFTDNGNGTASIVGTPGPRGGAYAVSISAFFITGKSKTVVTQSFTLIEDAPPLISPLRVVGRLKGSTFSVNVVTKNAFPDVASISDAALPPGLILVDHGNGTASISGAVGVPGTYTSIVHAKNSVGSSSITLVIKIR
jgi:hypothetical protein